MKSHCNKSFTDFYVTTQLLVKKHHLKFFSYGKDKLILNFDANILCYFLKLSDKIAIQSDRKKVNDQII